MLQSCAGDTPGKASSLKIRSPFSMPVAKGRRQTDAAVIFVRPLAASAISVEAVDAGLDLALHLHHRAFLSTTW